MNKILFRLMMVLAALSLVVVPSCEKADNNSDARAGWENMFHDDDDEDEEEEEDDDPQEEDSHWFRTRGVVCSWDDVCNRSALDYIAIAKKTGLNCFSIYGADRTSEAWKEFAAECAENGIDIEFEEHMLSYLLPREDFNTHPEYFRMDKNGNRTNDVNGCPSCEDALMVIKSRAMKIAQNYRSTNHKYYCWLDDGGDICHCDKCKDYSASDQALMFENAIIEGLRKVDTLATLAHLAYFNTMPAPTKVKPVSGIFLEYAPIGRNRYYPLADTWVEGREDGDHAYYLRCLNENLKVFPKSTAQVLDYWLDVSLFSNWDYSNLVEVPWKENLFASDLDTYANAGIHQILTYTAYMGAKYVKLYGYPTCLEQYGTMLRDYEKK